MLQHPTRHGKDWRAIGAAIRAVVLLLLTAVDDWVTARIGIRPVRWHARRLAVVAGGLWAIARYGPPAEGAEVEPLVYDVEMVDGQEEDR
ncbi:hypothetical protein ABZU32_20340 [Sphaerisporangium sp. NPDC005288]|uniref:hypothetical protein n=1 Tax=Sphaerisporangium sp. NPDC005288 TaxID=3155114 RepID=UPI0033BBF486